jgi:hypothetical protein
MHGSGRYGGENANILAYAVTLYYLRSIDRLRLLDKLVEDNSLGNFTFTIAGPQASRELLDSIAEIAEFWNSTVDGPIPTRRFRRRD